MTSGVYIRTKPVWNKGKVDVPTAWNKGLNEKQILSTCSLCLKEYTYYKSKGRGKFCSNKCKFKGLKGNGVKNPKFRYKNQAGYIVLRLDGKMLKEHRVKMELHLGRPLRKNEYIHHKNGIKDDNRIENLEVVTWTNHYGDVTCPHCSQSFKIK